MTVITDLKYLLFFKQNALLVHTGIITQAHKDKKDIVQKEKQKIGDISLTGSF